MAGSWKRWSGGGVAEAWSLGEGETWHQRGRRAGPVVVRVRRGLLLVTREGDPEDHLLGPGDAVVFPPRGRLVAWALEPALASVEGGPRGGATSEDAPARSPAAGPARA
jgi:hypothetical protein